MELTDFLAQKHPLVLAEFKRLASPDYLEVGVLYQALNDFPVQLIYVGHDEKPEGISHYFAERGKPDEIFCSYRDEEVYSRVSRVDESVPFQHNRVDLGFTRKVIYDGITLSVAETREFDPVGRLLSHTLALRLWDDPLRACATLTLSKKVDGYWLDYLPSDGRLTAFKAGGKQDFARACLIAASLTVYGSYQERLLSDKLTTLEVKQAAMFTVHRRVTEEMEPPRFGISL